MNTEDEVHTVHPSRSTDAPGVFRAMYKEITGETLFI